MSLRLFLDALFGSNRRAQIARTLEVYHDLYDRLHDIPLQSAREERVRLEQKLSDLREERRQLPPARPARRP